MKEHLISYGQVTRDFKSIAKYKNFLKRVLKGEVPQTRLDCYNVVIGCHEINDKFKELGWKLPTNFELFIPSDSYPPHTDKSEHFSYFIGLESGIFTIENVEYHTTPFVLYAFDSNKLHNTNFPAIMIN